MTTPIGCLQLLTTALKRLANKGDIDALRAYVRSDPFKCAFIGLDPDRRETAMRSYANAAAACEAKAPLVKPGRIDARRAQKANWNDPAMRAKLELAYTLAGDDDEKAARILGVSRGSARLAKRRHLDAVTAGRSQNASLQPRGPPPTSDLA
jgi:hypothetical protein